MFPRHTRLSRSRFDQALSTGRRLSSPNFSIIVSARERGHAVVVSKKVARLSVERHRIKRRVVAALASLTLPSGLVVFPKSGVRTRPFPALVEELAHLLSKI